MFFIVDVVLGESFISFSILILIFFFSYSFHMAVACLSGVSGTHHHLLQVHILLNGTCRREQESGVVN